MIYGDLPYIKGFPAVYRGQKRCRRFFLGGLELTQWTRHLNKKKVDVDNQAVSAYSLIRHRASDFNRCFEQTLFMLYQYVAYAAIRRRNKLSSLLCNIANMSSIKR